MKWIKRKILNWVKEDWNRTAMEKQYFDEDAPKQKRHQEIELEEYTRFELAPAVGGRILRVRRINHNVGNTLVRADEQVQTYVIPSGEDVGERVARIVNLELLK